MVGDSENDVKAGKNAGCKTALVDRECTNLDADVVVSDLWDFVGKCLLRK
jgi:phosphoglycolate phosphatase-like HAD superfamily hydrolase